MHSEASENYSPGDDSKRRGENRSEDGRIAGGRIHALNQPEDRRSTPRPSSQFKLGQVPRVEGFELANTGDQVGYFVESDFISLQISEKMNRGEFYNTSREVEFKGFLDSLIMN
jgi:hypothetical protein